MARQIINNSETGLVVRTKLNDNFLEVYNASITNFANSVNTQIAAHVALPNPHSQYSTAKVSIDTITTNYTVLIGDLAKVKRVNSATATNFTLPNNMEVGFNVAVTQAGTGQVTMVAASGATLRSIGNLNKTSAQHALITAFVVENTGGTSAAWLLKGDLV